MRAIVIILVLLTSSFLGCKQNEVSFNARVDVYPNPFVNNISIELELEETSRVKVYVYSPYLKAQMPGTLTPKKDDDGPVLEDDLVAGTHRFTFDFTSFESGVYVLDVVVNGASKRSRIIKQ